MSIVARFALPVTFGCPSSGHATHILMCPVLLCAVLSCPLINLPLAYFWVCVCAFIWLSRFRALFHDPQYSMLENTDPIRKPKNRIVSPVI